MKKKIANVSKFWRMGKFILPVLDYAELFPLPLFKSPGMSSSFYLVISQQENNIITR